MSFWLFTDTCCSLPLIKLGNNRWRNAHVPPPRVCCFGRRSVTFAATFSTTLPPPLSVRSFLSPYLDGFSSLSGAFSARFVVGWWQGCVWKPRHTVGSGTRQGHGYQLLVSSPFHHHLLSVLLSLSLSLSLFFVFVLPIILSVPVSRPFPPRGKQPSWGMCNVIECTENNNKLFLGRHSPSTSSGGLPSVFPSFRPSVPRSFRRYLRFKECMYIRR